MIDKKLYAYVERISIFPTRRKTLYVEYFYTNQNVKNVLKPAPLMQIKREKKDQKIPLHPICHNQAMYLKCTSNVHSVCIGA